MALVAEALANVLEPISVVAVDDEAEVSVISALNVSAVCVALIKLLEASAVLLSTLI